MLPTYQVSSQLFFVVVFFQFRRRSKKIDFQDGRQGSHLGFPIGTILAIFDPQVIPMLPAKFQVNWPFSSEEEAKKKNDF